VRARTAIAVAGIAGALVASAAEPAHSIGLTDRTFAASLGVNGEPADAASTRPALSATGGVVVFDSVASNLTLDPNGAGRDVFARSLIDNATRLISVGPGGIGGNGPSYGAAIGGSTVVFQSDASNLVEGDVNQATDVFARTATNPVVRVSVGVGGAEADGPSSDAEVSEDGRLVAFVSSATNLVPGDTNGVADVFVRDLTAGTTKRVSRSGTLEPDGPSAAPSISPNGRFVVFSSYATNVVPRDTNGVQDVFIADLQRGRVERVSVSTKGTAQNRSVIEPFPQVSDVSSNGRFVVFDSDATNLVKNDRNRDTDVFIRDRTAKRTLRISVDEFGFEGDNDSFNPSISADGRFVVFESFAEHLAPGDGPREDVFLYDLRVFAPTVISVGARGARRKKERTSQLLQRPSVSKDGRIVAFTSTASNLVADDPNLAEDVFVRVTAEAKARIVRGPSGVIRSRTPRLDLTADDKHVTAFVCAVDGVRFPCGRHSRLPRLPKGVHLLRVRAGGPGMVFQSKPVQRLFKVV
jgi:Tol biopolymer transport system component